MEKLSDYGSIMGTGHVFRKWRRRHPSRISKPKLLRNTELMTPQVPIIVITNPEGSTNPNPKRNFIWCQDFILNSHHPLLKNLISSPLHHIPQHCLHFFNLSNERYRSCSNPDQITWPQTSLSNRFRFTNFFKKTMMDNSLLSTNSQTFV